MNWICGPAIDDLLSGRNRGVLARASRGLLSAAAAGYALGVWIRNRVYDHKWKKTVQAGIPVVSIGNLTTGGTGKTPLAAFVAGWYRARGLRVALVSRGYGADGASSNDEARVLEAHCPGVPHLQNPDRAASTQRARVELESQIVILDDGFQHRRLARDLDIVLIDAANPWGYGHLLPRGLLREPLSALRRAHVVAVTRVDQVPADVLRAIRQTVEQINSQATIVEVAFPAVRLIDSAGRTAPIESLAGRPVAAFCGIGNPDAFRMSLARLKCSADRFRFFPDHHNYSRADFEELDRWIRPLPVEAVVCTEKDLVKIALETLGGRPLWALEIDTQVVAGREALERHLAKVPVPFLSRSE